MNAAVPRSYQETTCHYHMCHQESPVALSHAYLWEPPAPGRDAPSVQQQNTSQQGRHLCAMTKHGPAAGIQDAGP